MKVILFGATGMVGQGVLRQCLLDPQVERVLSITRSATGKTHEKLREIIPKDFWDLSPLAADLTGYDACFFCLGISSVGMKEPEYHHITYDLTMGAAQILAQRNPGMTFIYVSGASTDSSEKGRVMWARVKGKTENALLALPFKAAYMFRPGYIQPMHGVVSKTGWVRGIYAVVSPLYPVLKATFPKAVTSTELLGRAMIAVAQRGFGQKILENRDINAVG